MLEEVVVPKLAFVCFEAPLARGSSSPFSEAVAAPPAWGAPAGTSTFGKKSCMHVMNTCMVRIVDITWMSSAKGAIILSAAQDRRTGSHVC